MEKLGYIIPAVASTGEDAIKTAVETNPDLVLMDINLGAGMDGVEVEEPEAKAIREGIFYGLACNTLLVKKDRSSIPVDIIIFLISIYSEYLFDSLISGSVNDIYENTVEVMGEKDIAIPINKVQIKHIIPGSNGTQSKSWKEWYFNIGYRINYFRSSNNRQASGNRSGTAYP